MSTIRDKRIDYLRERQTINGRAILLHKTHSQNWLRVVLSQVQFDLEQVVRKSHGDARVSPEQWQIYFDVVTALEANFSNPVHYGDNKPGLFDNDRVPLLPAPVFSYFDLWQFGVSGDDGRVGFLRICGLPEKTPTENLLIATGLLLIDDAVKALENDQEAFAAYLMHQATECASDARLLSWSTLTPAQVSQAVRKQLSERGRIAGKASGKSRTTTARAKPTEVMLEKDKLIKNGVSVRDIPARLAIKFNVTADHIRRVLRKPA